METPTFLKSLRKPVLALSTIAGAALVFVCQSIITDSRKDCALQLVQVDDHFGNADNRDFKFNEILANCTSDACDTEALARFFGEDDDKECTKMLLGDWMKLLQLGMPSYYASDFFINDGLPWSDPYMEFLVRNNYQEIIDPPLIQAATLEVSVYSRKRSPGGGYKTEKVIPLQEIYREHPELKATFEEALTQIRKEDEGSEVIYLKEQEAFRELRQEIIELQTQVEDAVSMEELREVVYRLHGAYDVWDTQEAFRELRQEIIELQTQVEDAVSMKCDDEKEEEFLLESIKQELAMLLTDVGATVEEVKAESYINWKDSSKDDDLAEAAEQVMRDIRLEPKVVERLKEATGRNIKLTLLMRSGVLALNFNPDQLLIYLEDRSINFTRSSLSVVSFSHRDMLENTQYMNWAGIFAEEGVSLDQFMNLTYRWYTLNNNAKNNKIMEELLQLKRQGLIQPATYRDPALYSHLVDLIQTKGIDKLIEVLEDPTIKDAIFYFSGSSVSTASYCKDVDLINFVSEVKKGCGNKIAFPQMNNFTNLFSAYCFEESARNILVDPKFLKNLNLLSQTFTIPDDSVLYLATSKCGLDGLYVRKLLDQADEFDRDRNENIKLTTNMLIAAN